MKCPHPAKVPYPSKRAARRALVTLFRKRANGGPGRAHVYHCPAGHWHVGHLR